MKKFFFIAAMVSVALVSCTKNEPAPSVDAPQEITFMTAPVTKATAFKTDKKFISYAYLLTDDLKWNATNAPLSTLYINNKLIQHHADKKWAHVTEVYYWPKDAGSSLTFFAWTDNTNDPAASGKKVAECSNTNGIQFEDYDVTASSNRDIMVADITEDQTNNTHKYGDWDNGVPTVFYHILSQMRLTIKLDNPYSGIDFKLKSVRILKAKKKGSYTQTNNAAIVPTAGTWTEGAERADFPLFSGEMTVDQTTAMKITPSSTDYTILLPQTFDDADADTEKVEIVYEVTTNYGASVTETVTVTESLKTIFTDNWKAGKYYTLNITIGLNQILWDPAVEDWTEGGSYDWNI